MVTNFGMDLYYILIQCLFFILALEVHTKGPFGQCQQLKKKERKSEKYYDFLSFFVIIKQKEVTNDKISKKKK